MIRSITKTSRRGVTLLELMTSLAIASTLMTASIVVLRSSYTTWTLHENDLDQAGAANAVLRRIVRSVRQAAGVNAISAPASASGSLSVQREDGQIETWSHASGAVTYRLDAGSEQMLSDVITSLTFEGYEADGVTASTETTDIHVVRCIVTTTLPSGAVRTASSYAWLRAW